MTEDERNEVAKVAERLNGVAQQLDGVAKQVEDIDDRVDDLENEALAIKELPMKVGEIKGMVSTLQQLVTQRFDGVDGSLKTSTEVVEKSTSVKNAIQFAAVILVPIIVSIIGVVGVILGTR